MRRCLIAANWKEHPVPEGALAADSPYHPVDTFDVVVFPRNSECKQAIDAGIVTGTQHTLPDEMKKMKELGCRYVICGHSDRRRKEMETDAVIAAQVDAALNENMIPILCVGETTEEFEKNDTKNVLKRQLTAGKLTKDVIIAYEPVWAIGTGKNATPDYADEMHAFIRSLLPEESMRILYGGSVNAKNAGELLQKPQIDGLLIGGASFRPDEFRAIIETAKIVAKGRKAM